MLTAACPPDQLAEVLLPRESFRPFPPAADRAAWEHLPAEVRSTLIAQGEALHGYDWPPLPAVRFLDFARNGDRERYQNLHFPRRTGVANLVLAECVEGNGRFIDDLINGLWALCEESFWGVPAHVGVQRAGPGLPDTAEPIVDLFAAETSALLAWTCYLLGPALDEVSPLIVPRVLREMDRRILTPLLEREDFGWMGFGGGRRPNNWNPWINSNWLTSALLMEPEEDRRVAAVAKSMRSLDNFLVPHPRDGGCDEGPGYWGRAGASLFDCLELLHKATNGAVDLYAVPLVQEIGRFIYRVQICDHWFVNFADASALAVPPPGVVFGYGRRLGDDRLQQLGAWLAQAGKPVKRDSLGRVLPALFDFPDLSTASPAQPLPRDVWLPDTEVLIGRDREGDSQGFFLAAKGGHNAESHNHNDIGSFVVYLDGRPLIVDAGVGTYTRQTFSRNRYDLWTMQSGFHSLLPTFDGVGQSPGQQFRSREAACSVTDEAAAVTLDLAPAYPPEANVTSWRRTARLRRGKCVEVQDTYELAAPAKTVTFALLTPSRIQVESSAAIRFLQEALPHGNCSAAGRLVFPETLSATVEDLPLDDGKLTAVWGDRLTRIVFTATSPPLAGSLAWRFAAE